MIKTFEFENICFEFENNVLQMSNFFKDDCKDKSLF